jgi:hypothetical protein
MDNNKVFLVFAIITALGFLVSLVTNIIQGAASFSSVPQQLKRWLPFIITVCLVLTIAFGYTSYIASLPKPDTSSSASGTTNTQNPLSYPLVNGKLVLYDPLRDNSKGYNWTDTSFDYGTAGGSGYCKFLGGAYDAREIDTSHFNPCVAQNTDFSNFVYEVKIKIIRGDFGGIIFRGSGNNLLTDYQFEISKNGSYTLSAWVTISANGKTGDTEQTLRSGSSLAINTSLNQSNLVAVIANGNKLALYVNKQPITSISDNHYSRGQIGVVTGIGGEVICSNAKVWTQ